MTVIWRLRGMKRLRGLTLATTVGLVLAAAVAVPGSASASDDYTVDVVTVPGVDTGLVLADGQSVTVTATGTACWYPGAGNCVGPDGDSSVDTTLLGGFVLPGAPAWGLVGRVGNGPWVQVGSGPTTLWGTGELVFAMNDNYFADNRGSFTATVTVPNSCSWPGYGYGDSNHDHSGPPPKLQLGCYPGLGYGDTQHDHSGPPGRDSAPSTPAGAPTATNGSSNAAPTTNGSSNAASGANGSSKGARGRE